ncbi:hypothetical protein [Geomonas sp.]|uniref:hypothetical protein n=1 Tax=Geomonas sp. TaxID=2651584 RepID=UPI002B497F31|nr:hypothetical protein [Geomonas sp.]
MSEHDLGPNLGMLCRCCNFDSYHLPETDGLSVSERRQIEELCKMCIETFKRTAVNS